MRSLPIFLLALACASARADDKPDLQLRGTISDRDNHSYKLVPFEVPAGTDRITIQFTYTGKDEKTTIDLGLVGPGEFTGTNGFRGWSGGNKNLITVSATDATPSYFPGPIVPGRWSLLLGIPNIRDGVHAQFTANVYLSRNGEMPDVLDAPLHAGSSWYRGDLHMHDAHSDGSCVPQSGQSRVPCPLFLSAQAAVERHLDFIVVSDHNTTSQADSIRELQPYYDRLLMLPGRELTTFQGHANLIGTTAPVDFRVAPGFVADWNTLLHRIAPLGGVLSINHPIRPSGEICMGCGWTAKPPVDLALVQAIEVVNGMDADTAISGIPFWQAALDQGHRVTAVGGSDNHNGPQDASNQGAVGTPTTVVHADALSQRAIVAGLRAGHVFIDVQGNAAGDKSMRLLEFTAHYLDRDVMMGDRVSVKKDVVMNFAVHVAEIAGCRVEILLDGKAAALVADAKISQPDQTFRFDWTGDGGRHELHIAVRNRAGKLVLLGNPIYINF